MRESKKGINFDLISLIFFLGEVVFILGIFSYALWRGIPLAILVRDPAAFSNQPFYLGIVSQLGVTGWAMIMTMCFMAFSLADKLGYSNKTRLFFLYSSVIALVLFLDDQLQFHDFIFPSKLGIPKIYIYAFYLIAVISHYIYFQSVVKHTKRKWLMIAGAGFAISIAMHALNDKGIIPSHNLEYFFDDGPKYLGVMSWVAYHFNAVKDLAGRSDTD